MTSWGRTIRSNIVRGSVRRALLWLLTVAAGFGVLLYFYVYGEVPGPDDLRAGAQPADHPIPIASTQAAPSQPAPVAAPPAAAVSSTPEAPAPASTSSPSEPAPSAAPATTAAANR